MAGANEDKAITAIKDIEQNELPALEGNLKKLGTVTTYWANLDTSSRCSDLNEKFERYQKNNRTDLPKAEDFRASSWSNNDEALKNAMKCSHEIIGYVNGIKDESPDGGRNIVKEYEKMYSKWKGVDPVNKILAAFGCEDFSDNKLDKLERKKSSKSYRSYGDDDLKALRKVRKTALTYGIDEILRKSISNVDKQLEKLYKKNYEKKDEEITDITNNFLNEIGEHKSGNVSGDNTRSKVDDHDDRNRENAYSDTYDYDGSEGAYSDAYDYDGSDREDAYSETGESESDSTNEENASRTNTAAAMTAPTQTPSNGNADNKSGQTNAEKEIENEGKGLDSLSRDDFRLRLSESLNRVCKQRVDKHREDTRAFANLKERFEKSIHDLGLVGTFESAFVHDAPPLTSESEPGNGWYNLFSKNVSSGEIHNLKLLKETKNTDDVGSDSDEPPLDESALAIYEPENLPILFKKHTPYVVYNFSTRILWDLVGACSQYLTSVTSIAQAKSGNDAEENYVSDNGDKIKINAETQEPAKKKTRLMEYIAKKKAERLQKKEEQFKRPIDNTLTLATVRYCRILLYLSKNALQQAFPTTTGPGGSVNQNFDKSKQAGGEPTENFDKNRQVGGSVTENFNDDQNNAGNEVSEEFLYDIDDMKDPWSMMRATLLTTSCLIIKNTGDLIHLAIDNPRLSNMVHDILFKDIISGNNLLSSELSAASNSKEKTPENKDNYPGKAESTFGNSETSMEKETKIPKDKDNMDRILDRLYENLNLRLEEIKNFIGGMSDGDNDKQELFNDLKQISMAVRNRSDFFDPSKGWMKRLFRMMEKTGVESAVEMFLGKQYLEGNEKVPYIPRFPQKAVQNAV